MQLPASSHPSTTRLGLRENWQQFSLLVLVNAFVGGMVGLERSILPQYAEERFGLVSTTVLLSFIVAFGLTKALTNYFTGRLANRFGRKRLLVVGWVLALPIPLLLIYAPHWNWVVFANVLLGVSQGLTWSSTVVMKMDLVGARNRGLAMGLNEFAGYLAVGVVAFATGYIAQAHGVSPYPFYLGLLIAAAGLLLSIFGIRDTRGHVQQESRQPQHSPLPALRNVFLDTSFRHPNLSAVTQAGLVNNLNDGMMWGLFPVLLLSKAFNSIDMSVLVAIYPLVWGIGQLFTGRLADRLPHKKLLFWGMLLQGLAMLLLPFLDRFWPLAALSAFLGLGTALVYPTFLTAIAAQTTPEQRAESIGSFRLWRDLGYAIGALLSGLVADWLGWPAAVVLVGLITLASAGVIQGRMRA